MLKITGEEFPIGGWVCPPGEIDDSPSFLNDEQFKLLKESGINLMFANRESDASKDVFTGLTLAEKYGLYYLVNDRRFIKDDFSVADGKEQVKEYKKYKSFAGVNICDEPHFTQLPLLEEAKKRHFEVFKKTLFFCNLFPMFAQAKGISLRNSSQRSTMSEYLNYLNEYCDKVKPQILSYDFYPFAGKEGDCNFAYFLMLELMRSYAKKLNVPLWSFIQVTSWHKGIIRNTTEAEINWQIYTSLAFGVKGLVYFTYFTPVDFGGENFDDAMIDRKGNPTKTYYTVKNINAKLAKYGRLLIDCNHVGIINSKKITAYIATEASLDSYGNIENVSNESILTGCFEKDGRFVYLFVNNNMFEDAVFTIKFSKKVKFKDYYDDSINELTEKKYVLEKGSAVLIEEI